MLQFATRLIFPGINSPNVNPTFLTSVLMTITTFHVIPFIVVSQTKCVHTVFFIKIIRLSLRPSCKVPLTAIRPSEVPLRGDVIQAQPGFVSIVTTLNVNVFLVVGHINKDRVYLTTFSESCCPVNAFFTRQITESIEIAPARITDIYGNVKLCVWLTEDATTNATTVAFS